MKLPKIPTAVLIIGAYLFLSKKKAGDGPWQPLTATAAVATGSPDVIFSAPQNLPAGTKLVFDSAQPGIVYKLKMGVTALTATLDKPFSGTSNTASRVSVAA
jgi:hypothetical protein